MNECLPLRRSKGREAEMRERSRRCTRWIELHCLEEAPTTNLFGKSPKESNVANTKPQSVGPPMNSKMPEELTMKFLQDYVTPKTSHGQDAIALNLYQGLKETTV